MKTKLLLSLFLGAVLVGFRSPVVNVPITGFFVECPTASANVNAPTQTGESITSKFINGAPSKWKFDCVSNISGQTSNISIEINVRYGNLLARGDCVRCSSAWLTMYTPSIGHDSTYAVQLAPDNVDAIELHGDTTYLRLHWCLLPMNGINAHAVIKILQ